MRFPKSYPGLLLIVLLAFALRAYQLDFFSLRGDESFTVLFVQKPLAQMWYETLTVEPNPPLLYFWLRWWIELAGDSEFVTRFFALWFGVLGVPLVYRLGSTLTRTLGMPDRKNIALAAAFLMAINPYQIWHSQDVRNYTLWPAFGLLALVFLWEWYNAARAGKTTRLWDRSLAWFVLAELGALYTHYYEAFVLLALNAFVLVALVANRRALLQWIVAQIVLAVLYLPYPLLLSNRVSSYGEGSGRMGVSLPEIVRETFSAFVLGDTLDPALRPWLWIFFALAAAAGLVYLFTRDWRHGLFFGLYAGLPTLAVFALNTIRPLYLERYLNGIAPAYYLLIGFGIFYFARRVGAGIALQNVRRAVVGVALAGAAAVSLLALSNYWTNPVYAKAPDWRGLTNIINANARRGDLIIQNFPETSLLYYDRTRLPLVVYPETYLPDTETERQLNAMNANYERVWFIPAAEDYWDPDEFVEAWLDRRDDLLQAWDLGDFRLRLYGTPSHFLNGMQKVDATYSNLLSLIGYRTDFASTPPRLTLYWRVLEAPKQDLRVRLRVDGAEGTPFETLDVPVQGTHPTTLWRKNQIVVDQHELPQEIVTAKMLRVSVCDAAGATCLPLDARARLRDGDELLLALQP